MSQSSPDSTQPVFVDTFEMRYLGKAMRRHGRVVLLFTLIGLIVGAGWSLLSPPVYRAEAVLLVNIQVLRIGSDDTPMEVELIPPVRRTVGTVCQSDAVIQILEARLAGRPDPDWPDTEQLSKLVQQAEDKKIQNQEVRGELAGIIYYDQLSRELASLRAVDRDPKEAARIANTWAEVCRDMLVKAYGTTEEELEQTVVRIEQAKASLLAAEAAVKALPDDAPDTMRLEKENELDQAKLLLDALNKRYADFEVRRDDSEQIVRIVSYAAPPAKPINADIGLVSGLFALSGLLFGLAVSLFRGPGTV